MGFVVGKFALWQNFHQIRLFPLPIFPQLMLQTRK